MRQPKTPPFLARRSYRRRRMIDAARLVPVAGLFFILMPILWQPADTPEPDTATGGVYLFVVWFLLIVLAFVIAKVIGNPGLAESELEAPRAGEEEG